MSSFYPEKANDPPNTFDVVICGAGLAGLTLARQLRLENPHLKVALFDRTSRPFPDACLKVVNRPSKLARTTTAAFDSLIAILRKSTCPSWGLRFFFGDTRGPLKIDQKWVPLTFQKFLPFKLTVAF